MSEDPDRSDRARRAAELALVRVCNHYGGRPNFVLIGGLVPGLLCSASEVRHAGTTDVDVQVDLELAAGAEHARRLEIALKNADFHVDSDRVWRWETVQGGGYKAVIKFELLADLDDQPQSASVHFEATQQLGAVNLRGTGYASRDYAATTLVAFDQGARITADVNVTGLAGFLLAKTAAAHGRHKPKDYNDIAFVLIHHNEVFEEMAPLEPAAFVLQRFGAPVELRTALEDLAANFVDERSQGVEAYISQLIANNPSFDAVVAATDAQLAVAASTSTLLSAMTE